MNFAPFTYLRKVSQLSIGTGFNGNVNDIILDDQDRLYCVGAFTQYNGISINRICRLFEDGTLDTSFNVGTGLNSTALTVNYFYGSIWVGGLFTSYNGVTQTRFVRLNLDGSIFNSDWETAASTGANNNVRKIVPSPSGNGEVMFGGDFTSFRGTSKNRICRTDSTGALISYTGSANGAVYDIFGIDSNNEIGITGGFSTFNSLSRIKTTKTNLDGSSTPSLLDISQGTVVFGGYNISGTDVLLFGNFTNGVRLSANPTFTGSFNNTVRFLTPSTSNNVFVSGVFSQFESISRNRVAKLSLTSTSYTLDNTFVPPSFTNNNVNSLALSKTTNRLYLGGVFTGTGVPNRLFCVDSETGINLTDFTT